MNLSEYVLQHEMVIRIEFFFGILLIMALWERLAPRRRADIPKLIRWINNLGVVFLNSFLLRLIFPGAAVGMAVFAGEHGWGLFHYFPVPYGLAVIASVVAMDFVIYLQHVIFHAIPVLWRIHRMHHADLDFDVTTGIRFHPFEIILSMLIKFGAIAVIGVPVFAVVLFEVLLNATSMFNHGNVRIMSRLDRVLRWIVVTPEMHRVHHSSRYDETNSNFGFNLPLWDRFLGTYRDQPRMGHEGMTIGLENFRDTKHCVILTGMLAIPFIGKLSGYTINRRK
ncbi:putative membrane protein [Candidatus Kuenenia stuttgartiensis]|jgi:sterol desaturase/sphingolipid hydroxylase (fatty acid hydroxylase superfamily)|uniref:Putative membrane protein n=1 Tax=Kuenenia stuttgartiensis TaxID=174633 RepID=Q1PYD8_KUEST|nr:MULTISPECIES: sterol desaturase family protein [Kuenenia]MBE7547605.1 sterol desaturase family protein [Planctomycetia bacterium]MBZ0192779.1 sterol desaturase family protein [Candidatus Kuenenia stuttgartiensis]MCF6152921.1 sterol desaturase family protein [Candidatus Kuenenia stuttgartiensis]MCL4727548.1 sterol desaturase family protein [Candidatus Kuenenia stuttgartiensis]MCZ7624352.1 sterol desaturase family protein [Candidatus Kuenenia sp.]